MVSFSLSFPLPASLSMPVSFASKQAYVRDKESKKSGGERGMREPVREGEAAKEYVVLCFEGGSSGLCSQASPSTCVAGKWNEGATSSWKCDNEEAKMAAWITVTVTEDI